MNGFNLHFPRSLVFGRDVVDQLPALASQHGDRVLLITESILGQGSHLDRVTNLLKRKGIDCITYDELTATGDASLVDELASLARASKAQAIIGLGGMRALSIARCVSNTAAAKLTIADLFTSVPETRPVPYIEIPSIYRNHLLMRPEAIVKNPNNHAAQLVRLHPHTVASAIVDTAFLDTLSTKYAAAAMLDTLMAALEAYAAGHPTVLTDTLLQKGVQQLFNAAFGLSRNETDPRYRDMAAEASVMVAIALGVCPQGMGGAAAYTLNVQANLPKSWIAAILLPHVADMLLNHLPARMAELAPVMDSSIDEVVTEEATPVVARSIRRLVGRLDLPKRLGELDVDLSSVLSAVDQISAFPWLRQSQVPAGVEDIAALLKSAF